MKIAGVVMRKKLLIFSVITLTILSGCLFNNENTETTDSYERGHYYYNIYLCIEYKQIDDSEANDFIIGWLQHLGLTCGFNAWRHFRNDVYDFFQAMERMDADWMHSNDNDLKYNILSLISFWTANAKLVDPSLFIEIESEIICASNRIMEENTSDLIYHFILSVKERYEGIKAWRTEYERQARESYEYWGNVEIGISTDELFDWDWESRGGPNLSLRLSEIEYMIMRGEIEIATLSVMYFMLYGVSGIDPICALWVMATTDIYTRDVIIITLIERIVLLQSDNFDIYIRYIERLSNPRNKQLFDSRIQEVFVITNELIAKYIR